MELVISWGMTGLILVSIGAMFISKDWRYQLGALALQYLAVFWLVARHQPFVIGSVKLVAGWMVIAVLGMTRLGLEDEETQAANAPDNYWFSTALVGVIALVTFSVASRIEAAMPGLGLPVIVGGLLMIGAGLLQLSLTSNILRISISLLTLSAGFEIIYAAIENSILVTGLLAATNLGLGLLGAYLLLAGRNSTALPEEEIE
ncbi:MAG: hypothetical protein IT311_02605 [Anaerolineales bacterium]|nr:hypothetical protein [Anaerolineales bacterium]MCZ2122118.1 hypothetical protein [Anaerolineales bacterium]